MRKFYVVALVVSVSISTLCAQTIDSSFESPLPIRAAKIEDAVLQPDGKILLGGDISFYEGQRVHNLIRLNADGSLDNTFTFHAALNHKVWDIELGEAGEIVVLTRGYESARSVLYSESSILILNADGTLKTEKTGLQEFNAIAVQDDGKILACIGWFGDTGHLRRFNTDLSDDEAFNAAVTFDNHVADVQVFGDAIFVSGVFTKVNGTPQNDVVKLNLDGSKDASFDTGAGTTDYVGALTIQPDGKVLLGRTYINSFDGTFGRGILRLNADGSVDPGFNPPSFNGPMPRAQVKDGYIYTAAFMERNGTTLDRFFRLNMDGTLDESFEPLILSEAGAIDLHIVLTAQGAVIDNSARYGNIFGVSKYSYGGSRIMSFSPEVSRFGTLTIGDYLDGKLIVAGDFIRINGFETYGIARLNDNGSVDQSFSLGTNRGEVHQIDINDDGTILATTYGSFFKLNSKGEVLPEFNFTSFENLMQIIKFEQLDNGKIVASDPNTIRRLNADGSKDESFDIGTGICCWASTAFDFDASGDKVIYGSMFTQFNGSSANKLVRLNQDASVDNTFDIGTGPKGHPDFTVVTLVQVLDNGEILVGGEFNEFDGESVPYRLVKLSADGAISTEFNENQQLTGGNSSMVGFHRAVVTQVGDKILITQPNVYEVYALNLDGTMDYDFQMPVGIGVINDMISLGINPGGRSAEEQLVDVFAIGSFAQAGKVDPQFIVKFSMRGDVPPVVTDVEEFGMHSKWVEVYPNPVEQTLRLKFKDTKGSYAVTLIDGAGKKSYQADVTKRSGEDVTELDVQNLVPGFYLMKVVSDTGKTEIVKISKVR